MYELKNILVTGADGNLGGKLAKLLCDNTDFGIVAVSSFPERIPVMIKREKIIHDKKIIQLSSEEFFQSDLSSKGIVGVVHFAFSRAIFPNKDIASSLDYSLAAFKKIVCSGIQNAIYVSSQSVYGDTNEWRTVDTFPAPNSIYAMAKYAGEKLFESVYEGHDNLKHTIIRLDNVIQSQNLVKSLCSDANRTGVINIRGGKQVFSYIDILDVPKAIYAMLRFNGTWRPIYNVGPNKMRYTIEEIACYIKDICEAKGKEIIVNIVRDDTELWAGMDSKQFMDDTGWVPLYDIKDMIKRIYNDV